MKTITFTNRKRIGGYGCSEPGDNSGEYVRADVARALLQALRLAIEELEFDDLHGCVLGTGKPRVVDVALKACRAAISKAEEQSNG